MDAKITKQRLGNLLSYDWIKILAAVAAAVVALSLFFTMVGTRPTLAQTFTVYCYGGLSSGKDFATLDREIEPKLSYDILSVGAEDFGNDQYSGTLYTTRRAAGEGTAMFVADTPEYDEEGKLKENSTPLLAYSYGVAYRGEEKRSGFYDTAYFFEDCKNYLCGFFGQDFTAASALDESAAKESFLNRNGKDKRFLKAAKKEAGIAREQERLLQLREDYLFVVEAFEEGKLSHVSYRTEEGEYNFAISLKALGGIGSLVTYVKDGEPSLAPVSLMIFCNERGKGNDLRFETVSFLRYLVEEYGAANEKN